MLSQVDITLEAADLGNLWSALSVKLHGFLMTRIPTRYAGYLHTLDINPFSLYTYDGGDYYIVRVSALSDEAAQITNAMCGVTEIPIYGLSSPLKVRDIRAAKPIDISDIPSVLNKNRYKIHIITPSSYKSGGVYNNFPTLSKLFKPVINKINIIERLKYNEESLAELFSAIKYNEFVFKSTQYLIGGENIPAFTGSADITVNASGEELRLIKLLLGYATYSGIGAKTSMGMGGFLVE